MATAEPGLIANDHRSVTYRPENRGLRCVTGQGEFLDEGVLFFSQHVKHSYTLLFLPSDAHPKILLLFQFLKGGAGAVGPKAGKTL